METADFDNMLAEFGAADTNEKISMYVSAEGLTQEQYKRLLRLFPIDRLHLLEEAMA